MSPVNKSNKDVGFLEHCLNLDETIFLKVLSDESFNEVFLLIELSLISNNLSVKSAFTSISYGLSYLSEHVITEYKLVLFFTYPFDQINHHYVYYNQLYVEIIK